MRRIIGVVLNPGFLLLLPALAAPVGARGETIYAISISGDRAEARLLRFDSASPWELEQAFLVSGDLGVSTSVSLEFDPVTRELYGFGYYQCQVLCPPAPIEPVTIDPFSGNSSALDWPGLPAIDFYASDKDIHPLTRELRLFGSWDRNFRYSLASLDAHEDEAVDAPGFYDATAHTPSAEGAANVETFAIHRGSAGSGPNLVRIGGPGGVPPASSGEVTVIGPVAVTGVVAGFDISAEGTAYLSTSEDWGAVNRLYTIDLESGAVQELGVIATVAPNERVTGIAIAPRGLTSNALEIPALSRIGLAAFMVVLASVALWRARRLIASATTD